MDAWMWVLIIVAAVVVAALIWLAMSRRRRSAGLQRRFGDEYERRVEQTGDRHQAEAELRNLAERRDQLELRPLGQAVRARYSERWLAVQSRFVDQPDHAVEEADLLVAEVMRARGYPVERFDEQVDMVTADHPKLADDYRRAHAIQVRNAQRLASTDDLRQALIHYRSLFDELLSDDGPTRDGSGRDRGRIAH